MNPLITTFASGSSKTLGHGNARGASGPATRRIDFFLVGGGAGGGDLGGGGGGGSLTKTDVTVVTGDTHTITVGSAGTALLVVGGPSFPYRGGTGGNTAISISTSPGGFTDTGITGNIALGGGGGGKYRVNDAPGTQAATKFAGCGGGISETGPQGGGVNETGVGLQGFNGGYGTENSNDNRAGAGGGGGGADGGNCRHTPYAAGNGGAGTTAVSTWTPVSQGLVGASGYFAGGAGGGGDDVSGAPLGSGGAGGGGVGGGGGPNTPPGNGAANTGGGGGAIGVRRVQQYSGSGGTGCVIIRTLGSYTAQATTGSPDRREGGGYTYYTWTGDGSIQF